MAHINNKKFINSLSHRLGVTPKLVNKYLDGIIDEIIRETSRGNTVMIDRLGKFKTLLVGGYEQNIMGRNHYIEPKVALKMSTSKYLTDELSKAILPSKMRNYVETTEFDNENNYNIQDKVDWDVGDMYDIFEEIKRMIDKSNNIYLSE